MYCKYCNKLCKNLNSLHQHEIRCSENPNKIRTKQSDSNKIKISKSMKLNHNNSNRIWKEETLEKLKISSTEINRKYWTEEKRKEHSDLMKKIVKVNPDSYSTKNVSGRVKNFIYNNTVLKGSWEVKIAELLDDNDIVWTNKITPIPYLWENNWHLYFPDFYLPDFDLYIEVKGYQRERDTIKWSFVKKPLLIIKKLEIKTLIKNKKNILDYINESNINEIKK